MSEYLKHRYSGRIYQVMRDHGPDHPYLWSPWEYATRFPKPYIWENFLTPCEKPPQMPRFYKVSIPEELEWEKRQMRKENLGEIVVKPPQGREKPRRGRGQSPKTRARSSHSEGEYTLKDLCSELGIPPAQARKVLRSSGKKAPDGGWRWPNPEAAEPIKKILKNS